MTHVFISCARVDSDFALLLKNNLEQSGFHVWLDLDRLQPGFDWRQEIDNGIRMAFALIVVITPESKLSEYVTYEWAFALGVGVKVVPLLLEPTSPHPRLEILQYIDFTNRTSRPWDKLVNRLKDIYQEVPKKPAPIGDDELNMILRDIENQPNISPIGVLRRLRGLKGPLVLQKISEILQKPSATYDFTIRVAAVEALGLSSEPKAVPILLKMLRDDRDDNVKIASAEALGLLGDVSAVPQLIDTLKIYSKYLKMPIVAGNEKRIALSVADALRKIGTDAALEALSQ